MDTNSNNNDKPLETKINEHPIDEPRRKAQEIMEEERAHIAEKHGVPKESCLKRMGVWFVNDNPIDEGKENSSS